MRKLIPGAVLGTIGLVGVGLLGLQTASADDGAGDPNINKREEDSSQPLATVEEDDDNDDKSKDTSKDRSKQSRVSRYPVPAPPAPAPDGSKDVSRDVSREAASRRTPLRVTPPPATSHRETLPRGLRLRATSHRRTVSRNAASREAAHVTSRTTSGPPPPRPQTTRAAQRSGRADGTHRGHLELRRGRRDHLRELSGHRGHYGGGAYDAYLAFDEVIWGPVVVKVLRPAQVANPSSLRGLHRGWPLSRRSTTPWWCAS